MKNSALKIINPVLFGLFITTLVAMLLYRFGPNAMRGSETLASIHANAGLLFVTGGIIHLLFNWGWVRMNIFGIKKRKK
ncbi:MAG: hypothetical protein Q8M98_03865 [Candidatus Cloacimonadaceae bacterium]|nr:hypothetical protein [Candidatus Cloacimonadaceae bacterium]MDP3113894.1 hypothetical protein [Candidatus Cloacimonadaceae bacterium]